MKRFFKLPSILFLSLAALSAAFIAISCEVGLGESVDTYPPSLSVSYPSGDSLVIRDTFVMKGASEDETSLASVKLTFEPTESSSAPSGFSKTYNADFEPRGNSWSCTINRLVEGKYEIPDGEYKVTVVATDSAERTTTVTRVYKIDNTAPLVVIKRPASDDAYGRTLKVTADVSDENTLGTLTFTPYKKDSNGYYENVTDSDGNSVVYTQNNISGNGLEAIIARWYDSPSNEDQVKQNKLYREMLGSDSTSAKATLYYTVKVNDKAVSYPGEGSDETGNVSTEFYIYDDIYADIYSDSSSDGIHLGLTNKQLVQILNGNTTGEVATSAKTALAGKKYVVSPTTTEESKLSFDKAVKFTISPKNSPTYTVGGYEYENDGTSQTTITNNGVINITVTPGSDGYSLKNDTIRVLLDEAKYDSTLKKLVSLGKDKIVILGYKSDEAWASTWASSVKTGDNTTINIKIGTQTEKAAYIVEVEGKDSENNDIETDGEKQYGFYISSNSQPPVLKISDCKKWNVSTSAYDTSISNNSDLPDAKFQVSGTVTTETNKASVTYKITVKEESGTSTDALYTSTGTALAMPSTAWSTTTSSWTWNPTDAEIAAIKALDTASNPSYTTGLYVLTVDFDAESSSGLSTTTSTSRTFYIDTKAPELDANTVTISPIVTFDADTDSFRKDTEYVNGKITIKANVDDNHVLSGTSFSVFTASATLQSGTLNGNVISTTVDTSRYDNENLTIKFTPVDKAGNKGTSVTKVVTINQATDKPIITLTNTDKTIAVESKITKTVNLFDSSSNNKILGSITDDDCLDTIDVQWKKSGADDSTYASLKGFPKGSVKSSESLSAQLLNKAGSSLSEGVYSIKIVATDTGSVSGTAEFLIAVDDKDPVLEITSKSGTYQKKDGTITVAGTVQDASNKITLTSPKNGVIGIYEVSNVTSTTATVTKKLTESGTAQTLTQGTDFTVSSGVVTINWTDSFACVEGGETAVTYTAEDKFGKTSTASYSYLEDHVNPTITLSKPGTTAYLGTASGETTESFSGTASDSGTGASGLAKVQYSFDGSSWSDAIGTSDWNKSLDLSGKTSPVTVYFKAVDNAGNESDTVSSVVTLDAVLPAISDLAVSGANTTVANSKNYSKGDFLITGKITEANLNVTQFASDNGVTPTETSSGSGVYTFSKSISSPTEGTNTYRITATDLAGQTNTASITVIVDLHAPVPQFSAITTQLSAEENGSTREDVVNGKITVKGIVVESETSIKTTSLSLKYNGSAVSSTDFAAAVTEDKNTGSNVQYTIDTTKLSGAAGSSTDKKELVLTLTSTDIAGNSASASDSDPQTVFVDQSTDVPVVTPNNYSDSIKASSGVKVGTNLFDRTNSNKISAVVTDDDKLASVIFEYSTDNSTWTKFFEKTSINSASLNVSAPLYVSTSDSTILSGGLYYIRYTATDNGGVSCTNSSSPFMIGIDSEDPKLAISDETKSGQFRTDPVEVKGTVSDDSGVVTVTRSPKISSDGTYSTTTPGSVSITVTNGSWSDSFAAGSAGHNITYTATDKYGKTSSVTYTYKIDKNAPKIAITTPSGDTAYVAVNNGTSLQKFAGTAEDDSGTADNPLDTSGISYVQYSTDQTNWTNISGTLESWSVNIDSGTTAATKTYYFRSVDGAGNKSSSVSKKVTVDVAAPAFSNIKVIRTSDSKEISSESNVYYLNGDYKITGTLTEVNKSTFTLNTADASSILSGGTNGVYTFEKTISSPSAGSVTYDFACTDLAGQETSYSVKVFVDTAVPNTEISAITPQVTANSKENNVNGTITVTGTASDDDKVSNTILYLNGNAVTDSTGAVLSAYTSKVTKVTYNDGGTRFSYKIDTTSDGSTWTKWTDKSDLKVKFTTTDRSGNTYSAEKTVYIDQSTDIPTLTSSNMNIALVKEADISSAEGGNLYGMGSQTVYLTATDDDGVKSVTYKIDSKDAVSLVTDGTSTSVTKSLAFASSLTGVHTVTFVVTDVNGTTYNPSPVYFAIDNDVPSITGVKISSKTYESGMFVPKTFTISGSASDSSGTIKSIVFSGDYTESITDTSKTASWTSSSITETEGTKSVTVTASDKYGRTSTMSLSYKVDVTAPVWTKDDGTAVDTTVAGGTKSKTHTELASLVTAGTPFWFNSDTITLSGNAYDANGIASYKLKVGNAAETTSNGGSTYSIIASYSQGTNSAVLTAVDTAGNETVRTISINVDTVNPVINSAAIDGMTGDKFYIKSDTTVKVNVGATDATSGISKILVGISPSFKESDAIATLDLSSATATDGKKTGSVDISSKAHGWAEGSNTIYVRAVDVSGLESTESIISGLIVDTTAPTVDYTSHSSGATVNKTISLGGTYTETNEASTTDAANAKLYYKLSSTANSSSSDVWTASSATVTLSSGTWSISSLDTTGFTDETSYDFQVRITDAAGNRTPYSTGKALTLKVSQNSDRPVIKLSFATDGNARLNSGTFSGTISDDDGDVQKLYVQTVVDGGSLSDSSWIELSVSSGSWEIPSANKLSDGTYSLYFKVIDAKGETFTTSSTDGLTVPYMQYATNDKVYAPVTFSVDTTAATISLVDVTLASTSGADASYTGASIQNNKVLGGVSYRYAKFKINAADSVSKGSDLTVTVNLANTDYSATYDSTDKVYYTSEIDLSGVTSGIYQINVTATDQAKMATTFTKMVIIDNSSPVTIKNVTPSNTTEVTGDFSLTGLVQDDEDANSGLPESTEAMWYYIPKYSEKDTTAENLKNLSWSTDNFTRSSVTWTLKLSDLATTIGYDSETEAVSSDYSGYVVSGNSALYDIPVWFRIMDNAGNIGYNTENYIHYNPNADKPTVSVTYPGESEKDKTSGKIIMGGTARFQGSASDNDGIEGVYLQFDMNGDGTFENGEGVTGVAVNSSGKVYAGGDTTNIAKSIPKAGGYGFKAKGTLTWTSSIDLSGLSSGTIIKVRAIAIDNDEENGQLASAWTDTIEITVNNSIPQITDMNLVQYTDSTYATIQKQISYSEDVYVSGSNWRLEGLAKHADGISAITVDASNSITTAASGINKSFAIPLNKTSGSWTGTITATDNGETPHPKTLQVSVNIDNTAPTFADGSGELVLYKGVYGQANNMLSSTNYIQNSDLYTNGIASLIVTAKLTEEGSGFKQAVIYFERAGASENRVYNMMESYGTDRTANKTVISASKVDGSVYINSDGLAVLYKATVERSATTSIELTTNENIRTGGLVKIGGAYHRIAGVTSTAVTLEDEVDTKFASDVEFVYGMVIDDAGESRETSGKIKNDDNDEMVEDYKKSGSSYTWEAEVFSANIPDGPIQVHVVLFDKAGNSAHSYVTTRISNNAPRITTVKLGTDLNGDGVYKSEEYTKFYALSSHSNATGVDIWNLDTSSEMETKTYWTAKNGLSVVPEFVGGTTPFKYVFTSSVSAANLESPVKATDSNKKKGDLTVSSTDSTTGAVTTSSIDITNAEIDTTLTSASGEDGEVTYQFSFWDSTEETTVGVDSSWTILNAKVHQDLKDGNAPTGHIKPFFWNSSSDNSIYNNSKENGHIELEGDLTGTAAATSYGTDPKVSGKIVFRGLIYDDVRLGTLTFTFADFGAVTISSYSSGSWTTYTDGTSGKIPSATVKNISLDQNGHLAEYEIVVDTSMISGVAGLDKTAVISVTDASNNASASSSTQTANTVSATYYATDTQAANHLFYATEADAEASTSGASTSLANSGLILVKGDEATAGSGVYTYTKPARTPYYKMDVMPYVYKVETGLSKQKTSNWSVYNRTALGHYPVQSVVSNVQSGILNTTTSEDVTLHGFNLNGTTVSIKDKDNSDLSVTKTAASGSAMSQLKFNVATLASGNLTATVNSIKLLNNINNNDAMGSATEAGTANVNKYNMFGNGDTNNLLTDDLVFDVWEIDDRAAIPINGLATGVQMQVNQKSKMLNFAFANGGLFYSMGGTVDSTAYSSYYWAADWDTFAGPCVGFAVDSLGYTYSVDSGGDTNNEGSVDKYDLYTSRWGIGNHSTSGTLSNNASRRLEEIAIKTGSGTYDYSLMKYRYLSSELATSVSGSTTNLYLVNYDALTDEIRFRAGAFTNTKVGNKGGFYDEYTSGTSSYYSTNNCQVIANNSTSGGSFPSSSGTTTVSAISGRGAGQYVDVAIAKNSSSKDVACVIWYDAYDKCLKYTYYENPIDNWNSLKGDRTAAGWSTPVTIFSEGGEYCQIVVDANNHIHIAAYAGNGDVKYAYLSSYTASGYSESTNSCIVDASGSVGEHLTLDVALDSSSNAIPHIGYFCSAIKAPKYAYLVDTTDENHVPAGVDDNERFTGAWESTIVPTPSRLTSNREDKVNISVFKTTDGVQTYSTTDGSAPDSSNVGTNMCTSYAEGYGTSYEYSKCYGNGSKNAVFAYQISGGTGSCIETAQMR